MADETIRAILDLQNQEYLAAANQVVLENRSLATSFDEVAAAARAETLAMENTSSALSCRPPTMATWAERHSRRAT